MIVQHNMQALNAHRMLGITTSGQAKSTEKLSSGYRINRAADDAAGLSISEKMRKQIRGLSQASTNAQDGVSCVQTAEGALNEVHAMLQRMNELAVQAANGTNSESDRQSIQDEIDQLVTEIDRVSETTKFNETYLLKGDVDGEKAKEFTYKAVDVLKDDVYYLDGDDVVTLSKGTLKSTIENGNGANRTYYSSKTTGLAGTAVTQATEIATQKAVISSSDYYLKQADGTFTKVNKGDLKIDGVTYYEIDTTGTVDVMKEVTTPSTTNAYFSKMDIYDEAGNKIAADTYLTENQQDVVDKYFKEVTDLVLDNAVMITGGLSYENKVSQFIDSNGNEIAENGLYSYFDDQGNYKGGLYLKDGNKLVNATDKDIAQMLTKSDATIGALEFKLHVGADATDNNQITLKLEAMSSKSLGINNIKVSGKTDENAKDAIEMISAALKRVSEQRSSLGAIQNRLEHTIANLDNVVENTTASESRIRDVDMAEEMVKYSKHNILAQAGQSMLAQANQATQGVLSLLG